MNIIPASTRPASYNPWSDERPADAEQPPAPVMPKTETTPCACGELADWTAPTPLVNGDHYDTVCYPASPNSRS